MTDNRSLGSPPSGQQVPEDAESLQDGEAPVTDIGEVPITRDARNGAFQFGSQRAMLPGESGSSTEGAGPGSKVTGRKGHHVRLLPFAEERLRPC